nr:uncharacterized protein LOC113806083 [Penaeus vannamei]
MATKTTAAEVLTESPCKTGLVQSRIKGGILKKFKQLYAKLYRTSRSGVARLELYSDGKASVSGPPCQVIVASEVTKVATCGPLSFQVAIKDQVNDFSVDSNAERNAWVRMIQDVFLPAAAERRLRRQCQSRGNGVRKRYLCVCRRSPAPPSRPARAKINSRTTAPPPPRAFRRRLCPSPSPTSSPRVPAASPGAWTPDRG